MKEEFQIIYTISCYDLAPCTDVISRTYTERFKSCKKAYIAYDEIQELYKPLLTRLELQRIETIKKIGK